MADRAGQHLGNYRLIRLLGQGGFAEVYLGEHIHLGTEAAIKLLHTQLAGEDTDAFRNEARTIARLIHPHIVRVFDFGIEAETPFVVMDYAPNGTVRRQHPKGIALPIPTILSYIKQVADALQYAHNEHLVHRDVKPENLLIGRHQEVLLGDFGIALLAQTSRSQSMQDVAGTASYMAPEQFQGKPRPASDQYALAMMVYEWLTGACPFHGSFTEIASQQLFVPPPPLQGRTPAISPEVEQVVMTALAKDPHQRWASVQAFATAFEQASQIEPTVTIPAGHSSQPTELAPAPNESVIPTELVTPTVYPQSSPPASALPPTQIASVSPPVGTVYRIYHDHSEEAAIEAVAWSPDGKYIASISENPSDYTETEVRIWEVTTGHTRFTHPCGGKGVAWSPDGRRVIFSDQVFIVYEIATKRKTEIELDEDYLYGEAVLDIAWSPDGARIASSHWGKTVRVWDAVTGKIILTYRGHPERANTLTWSPDGSHIASSGGTHYSPLGQIDGTVQVWDVVQGRTIWTQSASEGFVAWSPDGRHIALNRSPTFNAFDLNVCEATTGKPLPGEGLHRGISAAWSPDSKRLVSTTDETVQIWDAFTGTNTFIYRGHSNYVNVVAWSPDGTRIASGDRSSMVHVWQAPY
jgi:serine/threonine protein kinase